MVNERFTFKEPVDYEICSVTSRHKISRSEKPQHVFFQESAHTTPPGRPGFVILADAAMVFEEMIIPENPMGLITFGAGLPQISQDGLELKLVFRESQSETEHEVLQHSLPAFDPANQWFEEVLDLQPLTGLAGRFEIQCLPGPDNDPAADWLAIYEFVISPAVEFNLNRARAFQMIRERNEIAHFSNVYSHSLYQDQSGGNSWFKVPARFLYLVRKGVSKTRRRWASISNSHK